MTVKDLFQNENLFVKMDTVSPFAWREQFPPENMGKLFANKFANYEIAENFSALSVDEIASELANFFVPRWNSIYKFMFSDDLLKLGFSETIEETTNDNGTTTENNSDEKINKVSAYNVETFSNNTSENNSETRNGTSENVKTRTYERKGYGNNFAQYRLKYLDKLQNDFIYDIIYKEVRTLITKPLYNNSL